MKYKKKMNKLMLTKTVSMGPKESFPIARCVFHTNKIGNVMSYKCAHIDGHCTTHFTYFCGLDYSSKTTCGSPNPCV